jgi:hypothetical protein
MRPGVVGPAARFVGVLPALARGSQEGSDCLLGHLYFRRGMGAIVGKD